MCPEGTVATDAGSVKCDACPARETSDTTRTRCACETDYYRNEENVCALCPLSQVSCDWGSTVADWKLRPGAWRPHDTSTDLRTCRLAQHHAPAAKATSMPKTVQHAASATGLIVVVATSGRPALSAPPSTSCPGLATCASNVVQATATRHLLSLDAWFLLSVELRWRLFATRSQTKNGGMCVSRNSTDLGATKCRPSFSCARRVVAIHIYERGSRLIVCALSTHPCSQVISAFSGVSSDTGSKGHPEPAASFAGALGATNVDFLQFVPMPCVATGGIDFYWKMCIRTLVPPVLISLLWLWPLSRIARRKPHVQAARTAAKLTMLVLEITTPKVATNVMQVFACTEFDGNWYLASELTIACDSSARRAKWVTLAGVCVALYPIGVPLLIFIIMYRRRDEINRLQHALKENDSQQMEIISARNLAQKSSIQERRPSLVVSVDQNLGWIVKKFEKFVPGRCNVDYPTIHVDYTTIPVDYLKLFIQVVLGNLLALAADSHDERACAHSGAEHAGSKSVRTILQARPHLLVCLAPTQAAVASIIIFFGACVLQAALPYRRGSDNEVELLAQYCIFLWCFSIVFRDMGISDPKILLSMGVCLIVATVGVFTFAFWRVFNELKQLRSETKENGDVDDDPANSESDELESDAGTVYRDPEQQSPAELKRGGNSPQDTLVTTASDEHGKAPTKPKSPWQLLGLCAAESEVELGDSPEDAHGGDDTAALLARLAEKDEALRAKDAEIVRLAALAR